MEGPKLDPLAVLGLPLDASPAEVHTAWRRLAEIYAPARHTDAAAEVQAEAARMLAEVNAAYLATQERAAQSSLPSVPISASIGRPARRRVTAVVAGVLVACAAAGVAVAIATRSDPTTAREAKIDRKTSAAQWLSKYHNYVNEVNAKWDAGPDMQSSTLGQQAADAMQQFAEPFLGGADAAAQLLRDQAANTTDPALRDLMLADAAQREASGQQSADAFDQAARATGAAQEFCGNMISLLRDRQGPLFPSPNRKLDRALGAWIDSTVAYFGTCPLVPDNAEASNRLASAMRAKQSAVARLVGQLG